jgi:Protein of unknown function (DUF3054)
VGPTRWAGAIAADVAAVVLFAAVGRNAHDERSGAAAVLTIAAPFLVGLAVGWIANPGVRRQPFALRAGVAVWLTTVAIGLVLRRTVWDRGTAFSFVLVTTVVLGALIVGWRAMGVFAHRRRGLPFASPPSKAGR